MHPQLAPDECHDKQGLTKPSHALLECEAVFSFGVV
jgi:hypothetical protein